MFKNTLLLAFREIRRNVLRSSLTMLGIVIGVAAVIIMVTIGRGATAQVTADIASLGANQLHLRPGERFRGAGGVRSQATPFKLSDSQAIEQEISGASAVAPASSSSSLIVYGNENWNSTVFGTNNDFFKVREWNIAKGRMFNEHEERAGKLSCIIGATIYKELFKKQDPIGAVIRLGKISCQIIGLLESKGMTTFGRDEDDIVIIPIRAFQRRVAGNQDVQMIYISAQSDDVLTKLKSDIESLMRQRRKIASGDEDNFNVRDMQSLVTRVTGTTEVLTSLLGAVAAVSLLVGGIGIMNIMLVSVTERTREIGIRLAIGALEHDVLRQFLVEAV
ncbi:MAG: ABC transporter permease, partial [Gammaproteobacteria bacterium]|nr:ABC transporter permease [Gammaproteobacteria bacterium]